MQRHNPTLDIRTTGVIKIAWADRTCTVSKMKVDNNTLVIHYCYCDDNPELIEKDRNGYKLSAFGISQQQISAIQHVDFKKVIIASIKDKTT